MKLVAPLEITIAAVGVHVPDQDRLTVIGIIGLEVALAEMMKTDTETGVLVVIVRMGEDAPRAPNPNLLRPNLQRTNGTDGLCLFSSLPLD